MRRRSFITLLGNAVAWPYVARAQQAERMRRIGVLMNTVSDDAEGQARLAAFHQGLQQLGWTVGHNVRIDYRWGSDEAERGRRGAAELLPTPTRPSTSRAGGLMTPSSVRRLRVSTRTARRHLRNAPGKILLVT